MILLIISERQWAVAQEIYVSSNSHELEVVCAERVSYILLLLLLLLLLTCISQCSVETRLRCGGIFSHHIQVIIITSRHAHEAFTLLLFYNDGWLQFCTDLLLCCVPADRPRQPLLLGLHLCWCPVCFGACPCHPTFYMFPCSADGCLPAFLAGFRHTSNTQKNPLGFWVKPAEKKQQKTCTKLNSVSFCHASNN